MAQKFASARSATVAMQVFQRVGVDDKTAKPMIATAMQLARKIGKIGALVGVCHGFVGNRMLHQRQREAEKPHRLSERRFLSFPFGGDLPTRPRRRRFRQKLILEGAMPWDVDRVIYDFGLPKRIR